MLDDTLTHSADDTGQFVAAYMCVRLIQNGVRCTEVMEELHHALHVTAFLRAGEEFAVAERAGTTLTEAVVRFAVQTDVPVELGYIFLALTDLLATFVQDRLDAMLNERECCKQSCRTGTHDTHEPLRMMNVLIDRRRIQRNRGVLGYRTPVLIRQECQVNLQLPLPCVDRTFDYTVLPGYLIRLLGSKSQYLLRQFTHACMS